MPVIPGGNSATQSLEDRVRDLEAQVASLQERTAPMNAEGVLKGAWPERRFWQGMKTDPRNEL